MQSFVRLGNDVAHRMHEGTGLHKAAIVAGEFVRVRSELIAKLEEIERMHDNSKSPSVYVWTDGGMVKEGVDANADVTKLRDIRWVSSIEYNLLAKKLDALQKQYDELKWRMEGLEK